MVGIRAPTVFAISASQFLWQLVLSSNCDTLFLGAKFGVSQKWIGSCVHELISRGEIHQLKRQLFFSAMRGNLVELGESLRKDLPSSTITVFILGEFFIGKLLVKDLDSRTLPLVNLFPGVMSKTSLARCNWRIIFGK